MSLGINGLSAVNSLLDALGGTDQSAYLGDALAGPSTTGGTVIPTAGASGADTTASTGTSGLYGLTRDDFFSMFLAQLQNQDPTKPMDNSEMVGQLAQFSMIETLQEVSAALKGSRLAEASALIGKQVTGYDTAGDQVTGIVDRVDQTSDGYYVVVGGAQISPDSLSTVTDPAQAAGQSTGA